MNVLKIDTQNHSSSKRRLQKANASRLAPLSPKKANLRLLQSKDDSRYSSPFGMQNNLATMNQGKLSFQTKNS